MSLFQQGAFRLRCGQASSWLIDCEALTDEDLATLAALIVRRLPPFRAVEGVARGGLRLAAALAPYVTPDERRPLLICDDVYSTGGSMEAHRAGRWAMGVVLFARQPVTHRWVMPLFSLTEESDEMSELFSVSENSQEKK